MKSRQWKIFWNIKFLEPQWCHSYKQHSTTIRLNHPDKNNFAKKYNSTVHFDLISKQSHSGNNVSSFQITPFQWAKEKKRYSPVYWSHNASRFYPFGWCYKGQVHNLCTTQSCAWETVDALTESLGTLTVSGSPNKFQLTIRLTFWCPSVGCSSSWREYGWEPWNSQYTNASPSCQQFSVGLCSRTGDVGWLFYKWCKFDIAEDPRKTAEAASCHQFECEVNESGIWNAKADGELFGLGKSADIDQMDGNPEEDELLAECMQNACECSFHDWCYLHCHDCGTPISAFFFFESDLLCLRAMPYVTHDHLPRKKIKEH